MTHQKQFEANAQDRPATPEDRKAYHAPKLEDYGEVSVLTQASPGPPPFYFDSGGWPNSYTSLT